MDCKLHFILAWDGNRQEQHRFDVRDRFTVRYLGIPKSFMRVEVAAGPIYLTMEEDVM